MPTYRMDIVRFDGSTHTFYFKHLIHAIDEAKAWMNATWLSAHITQIPF